MAENRYEQLGSQLEAYLELLLKWNARTNLTAIREPQEIVRRHFGESLFAAWHLDDGRGDGSGDGSGTRGGRHETLLDFGSGAGFPGLRSSFCGPSSR